MKKIIALVCLWVAFSSCRDESCSCTFVSLGLDLYVVNEEGEDLLHPETGSINHYAVQFHYLVDDGLVTASNPSFGLVKEKYALRIFASGVKSGVETMYITWPDLAVDTVKAEIVRNDNSTVAKKFWYNNELVFDDQTDNVSLHTVIKKD